MCFKSKKYVKIKWESQILRMIYGGKKRGWYSYIENESRSGRTVWITKHNSENLRPKRKLVRRCLAIIAEEKGQKRNVKTDI